MSELLFGEALKHHFSKLRNVARSNIQDIVTPPQATDLFIGDSSYSMPIFSAKRESSQNGKRWIQDAIQTKLIHTYESDKVTVVLAQNQDGLDASWSDFQVIALPGPGTHELKTATLKRVSEFSTTELRYSEKAELITYDHHFLECVFAQRTPVLRAIKAAVQCMAMLPDQLVSPNFSAVISYSDFKFNFFTGEIEMNQINRSNIADIQRIQAELELLFGKLSYIERMSNEVAPNKLVAQIPHSKIISELAKILTIN